MRDVRLTPQDDGVTEVKLLTAKAVKKFKACELTLESGKPLEVGTIFHAYPMQVFDMTRSEKLRGLTWEKGQQED